MVDDLTGARPRVPGQRCLRQMPKAAGSATPMHTHTGTRMHKCIQDLHVLVHTHMHACARNIHGCAHVTRMRARNIHACAHVTRMRAHEHTCAHTHHMPAIPRSHLKLFAARRTCELAAWLILESTRSPARGGVQNGWGGAGRSPCVGTLGGAQWTPGGPLLGEKRTS